MRVAFKASMMLLAFCLVGWFGGAARAQDQAQMLQGLGPQFVIFRDKVQDELKLTDEQKKKVETRLQETLEETMKFFQGLSEEERPKKFPEYQQKAQKNLASFLKETLKEDQLKRLREIGLQQQGLFAVGQPDIGKEVKITDEQKKKVMSIMQDLQKKAMALQKEAQEGGNPQEIMPKMMKLRKDHEGKVEALLTDVQKKQWKEMLGKQLDLGD